MRGASTPWSVKIAVCFILGSLLFAPLARYRIDFLAGRTARNPHADAVLATLFEQLGDDGACQQLERSGIAKKACHRDQQISKRAGKGLPQRDRLPPIFPTL